MKSYCIPSLIRIKDAFYIESELIRVPVNEFWDVRVIIDRQPNFQVDILTVLIDLNKVLITELKRWLHHNVRLVWDVIRKLDLVYNTTNGKEVFKRIDNAFKIIWGFLNRGNDVVDHWQNARQFVSLEEGDAPIFLIIHPAWAGLWVVEIPDQIYLKQPWAVQRVVIGYP